MKKLGNESGQTMVFAAIGMAVLLGFAAFATDIGVMLRERNLAQSAADSAAIAGALNLHYGSAAVSSAAISDAKLNGFTNGSDNVTVTVSDPPSSSEVANSAFASSGFVKVTITKTVPGFFMKVFNRGSMDITASAVATNKGANNSCIYVLSPNASDAMLLQGSFVVNAPGCGILINSNSGDALHFKGGAGTLTAGSVGVVGGDSGQTGDSNPAPVLGVAPANDPLAWEPPVSYDPSSCTGSGSYTLTGTIGPASYGTICYGGNVTLNNVTMNPGVYVFTGNVSFSGNVTGLGVTFYLTSGGLTATTNSTLDLVAPQNSGSDTYTYNGILIDMARGNTSTLEFEQGNATGTLTGIIYAPSSNIYIHDSGGDSSGGTSLTGALDFNVDLVVNTFEDQTGELTLRSYTHTSGAETSPLTRVTLVE